MLKSRELERLATMFGWVPSVESPSSRSQAHHWAKSHYSVDSTFSTETWEHINNQAPTSWWYSTRNEILWQKTKALLQGSALWDIGGGSGIVARFLMARATDVVLVEPSAGGTEIALQRGVPSLCATLEQLRLPDACLPAVGMFDVLEHLENREQALNEVRRVLMPGGHLLLTVPALSSLWSGFDVAAGHYLRYNRGTLRTELERHDFEIQQIGYFFALTVLPLFAMRAIPYRLGFRKPITDDETLGASGGVVGRFAARLERMLAMRTPIGSSLLVVARKRAK